MIDLKVKEDFFHRLIKYQFGKLGHQTEAVEDELPTIFNLMTGFYLELKALLLLTNNKYLEVVGEVESKSALCHLKRLKCKPQATC